VATHLADTSALARLHDDDVAARIGPMLIAGRIATCSVIDLEVLYSARDAEEHAALLAERRQFPRVSCGDEEWERAYEVQASLLARGHRLRSPTDLVIAASAEHAGLSVLHYDQDFDLIAEVTGQPTEWVVPRRSVP
jgi:predicted nucleic acid-binding protein